MDIRTRIGRTLAGARAERGMLQSEAARLSGICQQSVSLVETGRSGSPNTWEPLARVYGISSAELLLRAAVLEGIDDE